MVAYRTKTISVAIPSLPSRVGMLGEALKSVYDQEMPAHDVCVAVDTRHEGAARTRQRALQMATSEWVAFLDDDDLMLPQHVRALYQCAVDTGADYTFSYFVRAKGGDPLGHFGKMFNPQAPHHTTMTVLVRRELAMSVGFLGPDMHQDWSGEDWRFTLGCIEAGAKIVHHPEETWIWNRHRGNTSGLATKGDAAR